jgi:hypothetical protein
MKTLHQTNHDLMVTNEKLFNENKKLRELLKATRKWYCVRDIDRTDEDEDQFSDALIACNDIQFFTEEEAK